MALPGEPNSKEEGNQNVSNNNGTNKDSSNDATQSKTAATSVDHDDKDFDPTVEALIDEMDDERTLEEEEALDGNNATAVQNELDELKKESEMPIEELLAYYERMRNEAGEPGDEEDEGEMEDEDEEGEEEEEDEMDDSEVRKQESTSKLSTDANKCTNSESLQHNHNDHNKQRPQHQQQPDFSLITPPQPHQTLDHSITQTIQSDHDLGAERERQLDLEKDLNCTPFTKPIGDDLEINRQRSSTNEPNMTLDNSEMVHSSRHKHSLTEFMLNDENVQGGMFKTLLDYDLDDSDDLDEDYSYTDDERGDDERDWRRFIHIGPEYQADVPEGLSEYEGDLPPYEPEDKLVWRCNPNLTYEQIIDYLKRASSLSKKNDFSKTPASVPKISVDSARLYKERLADSISLPNPRLHPVEQNLEFVATENPPENLQDMYMTQSRKRVRIEYELEQENAMDGINQSCGDNQPLSYVAHSTREDNSSSASQDARPELSTDEYFQDEEQLLYLLLQCNFNLEEALRRRGLDPSKYYLHEPMSLWSQEECLGFEHGLRVFGKDFRSIRDNNVQTRTHAEVVAFYYLWKKSERHDVYTNQYKLDRKRSLTHPGTTDYMDKFIEDNESALNASSNPTPTPTDSTAEIHQIVDEHLVTSNSTSLSMCNQNTSDLKPNQISCLNLPQRQSITSAISGVNHCDLNQASRGENCEQKNPAHVGNTSPLQ